MRVHLFAVLLCCCPWPSWAEGASPVQAGLDEGFQARPIDEPAGSLLGGVIAMGPGLFVHGLGHLYAGERGTALELLLAEVAGAVLIVSGELLGAYTNDAGAAGGPQDLLSHAGLLLFVGSWLSDIIGTFKGAEAFDPDTSRLEGTVVGLGYRYNFDPLETFRHHVVLRLVLDRARLYARPLVDLSSGERLYRLDLGARLFRGQNPHNEVALGGVLGRRSSSAFGYGINGAQGYLAVKADLGQLLGSLRNVYLVSRTGLGVDWYQLGAASGEVPSVTASADVRDVYLALESGAEVNSGPRTHLHLLVVQDPTLDVPAFTEGLGVLRAGLVHRYSDTLDIEIEFTGGAGWGVWLGLGYGL